MVHCFLFFWSLLLLLYSCKLNLNLLLFYIYKFNLCINDPYSLRIISFNRRLLYLFIYFSLRVLRYVRKEKKRKEKKSFSHILVMKKSQSCYQWICLTNMSSMKMVYNFYPVKNINQDLESFFLFGLILDV
jgi:hypothetical protein